MIEKFVSGISTKMGIKLSKVSLEDGAPLGCNGVHLLKMASKGHVVGALVFQTDIENLKSGIICDRLEVRVSASLSRLQMLIEPR